MKTQFRVPLIPNRDDLSIGELVALLESRALLSSREFLLEIESNIAELLLDIPNDFALGTRGERVSALHQELSKVVGQVATREVKTENRMG